jgi:hypothetical protein
MGGKNNHSQYPEARHYMKLLRPLFFDIFEMPMPEVILILITVSDSD